MNSLLQLSTEKIRKLPKADIHVHLDGSVRLETIVDISKRDKIKLPSYEVDGLKDTAFKKQYNSLEEYLRTFGYSCGVMQTPEDLERIAYEFSIDNQEEGIRYVEVRFAPQLHINSKQDMHMVLESVNKGMLKAKKEFNKKPQVKKGKEPPFNYGIITCAMRNFGPYSEYYATILNTLQYSQPVEIRQLASSELAKAVVHFRRESDIPIIGFDLAGAEDGYPAKEHLKAFQWVQDAFMHKTVHAGEAYGPESIFQAITDLHADRIGHGYYLLDPSKIQDEKIIDKPKYVEDLCQYIASHRITLEVCLTSNMQTNPGIKTIKHHNFGKMLQKNLSLSLCTDNRTVSRTTLSDEILIGLQNFDITLEKLKELLIVGFRRSFFPGTYDQKRAYIRQCSDYYDEVMNQTRIEAG